MRSRILSLRVPKYKAYATVIPEPVIRNAMGVKPTHTELTASEPRGNRLHRVGLLSVLQSTRTVRLVRLKTDPGQGAFKASDLLSAR